MKKIMSFLRKQKEANLYLLFGILTTAVDYAFAFLFCYVAGFGEITSNNIAWILSVAFAYITNKWFVFEAKSLEKKRLMQEIVSFFGARFMTLLGADVIIFLLTKCSVGFLASKIVSSVFVVIVNYILSKCIIFKSEIEEKR